MRPIVPRIAIAVAAAAPALAAAHDEGSDTLLWQWTLDPWIVVPLLLSLALYCAGALRVHRVASSHPSRRRWQTASFCAGWLSLAGALVSPLHWLGEHLFTAHMIEHEIVIVVAAPLIVLARPTGILLWALPRRLRLAVGGAFNSAGSQRIWQTLLRHATLLHGIAIWAWHAPRLFDAAVTDVLLHRLQHLSFFATALLFWWSIVRSRRSGIAVWHLFATMFHTGSLGALIVLAPRVMYTVQTSHALQWGLPPIEDQQLAGLIMWVPPQIPYAIAALWAAAGWIRGSRRSSTADNRVPS